MRPNNMSVKEIDYALAAGACFARHMFDDGQIMTAYARLAGRSFIITGE